MLVEILCLVSSFGQILPVETLSQPLPYVKNLRKSSSDPTLPVIDLTENFQSFSNCKKPVNSCSSDIDSVTCFGTRLPYSSSGPPLTNSSSVDDWSGLSLVPACWATVQPLLCAVFHPRCDSNVTQLVPRLLCTAAVRPCQVVTSVLPVLPDWLDCDNDNIFSDQCDQDSRAERARFNVSTTCVSPLVLTQTESAYWSGVEECGLRCQSPLLSSSEYDSVHSLIAGGATVSLLASLFAVFTFFVDWKGGSKYPARAIFYLNLCFVVANVGWLAQFSSHTARDDIVCRSDGVARHQEPGQGENMSCVIIFILVYFFSQAAAIWTAVVCYSW